MKTSFYMVFSLCLTIFLVALLSIPQDTQGQRLNHANFGGGGGGNRGSAPAQNFSRPASAPAMNRPAPAINRPAPVENRPSQPIMNRPAPVDNRASQQPVMNRPAPTQQVENRVSINGGSYNIGNHDYNRNNNIATARPPFNTRENVPAQRNVSVRENVNVYHNHYQPIHSYAYHPYHPYYWGHNWHPLGFLAASLAADAYLFSLGNQQYYYDEGVYYEPSSGGYSVVPAPIGATVSSLPPGYETTMVGNDYYYYYGGAFYINTGNDYQVVPAPFGAVVTQIPDGAVEQVINGESYLVYNNTYYQPVSQNGQDAYEVVQVN